MKVTLIADSCFIFEHNGKRILTDPWIGTPIAGGAWIQFPPPVIKAKDVGPLDYIFISHIHEDHCDLHTIKHLDRDAEIVLMDRKPNFVADFLDFHGLTFKKVHNIKLRDKFEIMPGFLLEPVEADPAHKLNHMIDSSLLIHYDGKSIYFANDNPPYEGLDDYLKQYDFELAIIPPVGGSGYPAFYENLSDEEKTAKAQAIQLKYFEEMLACLRRINPRLYSVAANGHVLSGENAGLNKFMCWPANNNEPFKYLRDNTGPEDSFRPVIISPGVTLNLQNYDGASYEDAVIAYDNEAERTSYIEEVAAKVPYFFDSFDMRSSINFKTLFELAHRRMRDYLARNKVDIDMRYLFPFDAEGDKRVAAIDMQAPYDLSFHDADAAHDRFLTVNVDPRALYFLLTGGFSWNIADATGFIKYNRVPDDYHYDTYIALNFLRI
jgi:UDP-MurNAc hydroxylase